MNYASSVATPEWADVLRVEGARLIEVADADLGALIPSCAGWKAADLLDHVAGVWEAFRVILESASIEPPDFSSVTPAPEDRRDLREFASQRLSGVTAAIESADSRVRSWSSRGEVPLGFYGRRAVHETVVHRIDAELGAGRRTPVDPTLAFDGVDELYSALLIGVTDGLPGGSLHLHQTDGDGELMLQIADGQISVTHEHAKGDAALRATGEELLLACWGRRSLDGLELFGDRSVAEAWLALSP